MSTPAVSTPRGRTVLTGAAVLASLSLFWSAAENHYGQCVSAQVARYPSVAVSAFNTKGTGPLKVAYDAERRQAVGKCKRFLIL